MSSPMFVFKVLPETTETAKAALQRARQTLSRDQAFEVAMELGFCDRGVQFDEKGNLQIELTSLQFVALAAALLAASKTGGATEYNEADPDLPFE